MYHVTEQWRVEDNASYGAGVAANKPNVFDNGSYDSGCANSMILLPEYKVVDNGCRMKDTNISQMMDKWYGIVKQPGSGGKEREDVPELLADENVLELSVADWPVEKCADMGHKV